MIKTNTILEYFVSIIEVIGCVIMLMVQNVFILSILFSIKFIQYSILLNYENLKDKHLKHSSMTVLSYLKKNGPFSFLNVTNQFVSFGSIFAISLILLTNNFNYILLIFLVFIAVVHTNMVIDLWNYIRTVNVDNTSNEEK